LYRYPLLYDNPLINDLPKLLEKTFPVPQRFRNKLPHDIADLSKLLTNQRGQRSLSYLARPGYLSAYLHYFLPWNICRLCIVLPDFNLNLENGNTITDLGCGPLTFACALWISRPDLRNISLEINCIDRSGPALEAGKKLFEALSRGESPWKFNFKKKEIDFRKTNLNISINKKSSFVCAVNVFNEFYENLPHNNTEALRQTAEKAAKITHNEAGKDASIFIMEPGVPRSGHFISMLRGEFLKLKRQIVSPCTHFADCPLTARRKEKWCHFAFDTKNAPKELLKLSDAAKMPKERLVFSYLLTGPKKEESSLLRIISDSFPVGEAYGRYGCSSHGLVLLKGSKSSINNAVSGSLAGAKINLNERDEKSGAYTGELNES